MKINILLRPMTKYKSTRNDLIMYEQVALVEENKTNPDGFILGIVHVDTFWTSHGNWLYTKLSGGESVEAQIVIVDD